MPTETYRVAFHEAAHAIVAMTQGEPVNCLTASAKGGQCLLREGRTLPPRTNALWSLAGYAGEIVLHGAGKAHCSQEDFQHFHRAVLGINPPISFDATLAEAKRLIQTHKAAAVELANRLSERGRLDASDVRALCSVAGSPLAKFAYLYPDAPPPAPLSRVQQAIRAKQREPMANAIYAAARAAALMDLGLPVASVSMYGNSGRADTRPGLLEIQPVETWLAVAMAGTIAVRQFLGLDCTATSQDSELLQAASQRLCIADARDWDRRRRPVDAFIANNSAEVHALAAMFSRLPNIDEQTMAEILREHPRLKHRRDWLAVHDDDGSERRQLCESNNAPAPLAGRRTKPAAALARVVRTGGIF